MANGLYGDTPNRDYLAEVRAALAKSATEAPPPGAFARHQKILANRAGDYSGWGEGAKLITKAGLTPSIRGTREGFSLYADNETEPLYSGTTGKPYFVEPTPTSEPVSIPESDSESAWAKGEHARILSLNEKANADYQQQLAKRQEIIKYGAARKAPWELIEKLLKAEGVDSLKEPKEREVSADIMKMIQGEKKGIPAPKTEQTTEGIKQWNERTGQWESTGMQSARGGYQESAVANRIVDKFNADPVIKKSRNMSAFAQTIIDAAESDNPIAHASLPTLMARASGEVGALSEADKAPFGGSRALVARIEQVAKEWMTGKRTPENIEFVRQLSQVFINASERQETNTARLRAKQYSIANKKMFTEEDIYNMLTGGVESYEPTEKSQIPSPSPTQPQTADRTITKTGTDRRTGQKVIMYSDGSVEYGQ